MDKGVTIREIADRAGVSTATVSNVIHGKTKRVSPSTIRRVQELIREMGYGQEKAENGDEDRASAGARLAALVVNPHKVYEDAIGADPFYGKMIGMVERRLREKGYYMMFYSASDMDDIFGMVMSRQVEGVITLTLNRNDSSKIAGLIKRPVVSIDACGPRGSVMNIGLDDWQGGRLMTEYLEDCGYGPIYVCAGRDHGVDHLRYTGCLAAGKENCLRFVPLGLDRRTRQASLEGLMKPIRNCMQEGRRPALFFLSDVYALEGMRFFVSRGLRIPEDVGIAGFDDIFCSSLVYPGLTTIRQDMKRKAELAVDRLVDLMEGRETDGEEREILLPVKLVVRESTRALPEDGKGGRWAAGPAGPEP